MNGRSQTMSPVSTDGSEWSGINRYQDINHPEPPYSPSIATSRGQLVTPPLSTASNGPPNNGPPYGPSPSSKPRRPTDPSPPTSRSSLASDGTLSDIQSRKYRKMEDTLAQHYSVLRRFLQGNQAQQQPRPNKARDKLLRLSPVQFHELSTDVYDELLRRQATATPPSGPNRPMRPPPQNVPTFLPARQDFHEKRNQARQKLSSLQVQRFRDLATDVFCELERRFPKFAAMDINRQASPANSMRAPPSRGPTPNGFRPDRAPNGYPFPNQGPPGGNQGPPRSNTGPSGPGPRSFPGGPLGGPPGPGRGVSPGPGFPPRQNSLGGLSTDGPGANEEQSPDGGDYGRPQPRQFQSNTIVPNKSTMVEEDDDEIAGIEEQYERRSDAFALDGPAESMSIRSRRDTSTTSRSAASSDHNRKLLADAQSHASELQERIEELEMRVTSKDDEIDRLHGAEQSKSNEGDEWLQLRSTLEKKVEDAELLNQSLKDQLDRINTEQGNVERELRSQLDLAKKTEAGESQMKSKCERLERDNQDLQEELQEQQRVTDDVRQEASKFLREMREMSENHGSAWERQEQLTREVDHLRAEVQEWKSRYTRTKTQLRHMRASSMGLSIQRPDAGRYAKDNEFKAQDGLVKDVNVTKFQISIDELLRIARSSEPAAVLDHMKSVVLAVRHITHDIDAAPNNDDEMSQRRSKLKTKVSATANNLITASKNFASSKGLSPVSLVDAAASHLTSAVVELVLTVKIRSTPAGELEDDDDGSLPTVQSPGYFNIDHSTTNRTSDNNSVYSALSSPPSNPSHPVSAEMPVHRRSPSRNGGLTNGKGLGTGVKLGFGIRAQDSEIEELKAYLEDQTDTLVTSIQSLVASIRGEKEIYVIRDHINVIANVVGKVVSSTKSTVHQVDNPLLTERAEPVIQNLAGCQTKLVNAGIDSENIRDAAGLREFTNKLPPLAFEIARETKELVQRIDRIDFTQEGDDDDNDFRS